MQIDNKIFFKSAPSFRLSNLKSKKQKPCTEPQKIQYKVYKTQKNTCIYHSSQKLISSQKHNFYTHRQLSISIVLLCPFEKEPPLQKTLIFSNFQFFLCLQLAKTSHTYLMKNKFFIKASSACGNFAKRSLPV